MSQHYILPEALDSGYHAVMDAIRSRMSPYAELPIQPEEIPNTFIDQPIYILPAERQVLAHKQRPFAKVDATDPEYALLLVLAEIRVCRNIIVQTPQQLREMAVEQYGQYSEVKMKERVAYLDEIYATTLNPSSVVPTPGTPSDSGALGETLEVLVTE